MPVFVQSAMNPGGTWQQDGMDASEAANRAAAFQAAQMQSQIAAQQLQAHLEQARMHQQGAQFEEGRADTMGMHGQDIENANRMQQAGFANQHSILDAELAARNHEADLLHGPNSLEQRRYALDEAFQNRLMSMLPGGQTQPAVDPLAAMHAMPPDMAGNPMAGYGNGSMPAHAPASPGVSAPGGLDMGTLRNLAVVSALRNGGQIPDFAEHDMHMDAERMQLEEAHRAEASRRIQAALDAGDVNTAKQIASSSGAQMPRIDSGGLMSRPEVAVSLGNVVNLAKTYATSTFGSAEDVAKFKQAFEAAVSALSNHGVNPDEARAAVAQQINAAIPGRAGAGAVMMNRLMGGFAMPMLSGTSGSADRANQIHDAIGY